MAVADISDLTPATPASNSDAGLAYQEFNELKTAIKGSFTGFTTTGTSVCTKTGTELDAAHDNVATSAQLSGATFTGAVGVDADLDVGGTKFVAYHATGNIISSGTATFLGDTSVGSSKFTVAATSGNTTVAGTLGVTGTVSLTDPLDITEGGTGTTTAGAALTALGGAASGANSDITSLASLASVTATGAITGGTVAGDMLATTLEAQGKAATNKLITPASLSEAFTTGGGFTPTIGTGWSSNPSHQFRYIKVGSLVFVYEYGSATILGTADEDTWTYSGWPSDIRPSSGTAKTSMFQAECSVAAGYPSPMYFEIDSVGGVTGITGPTVMASDSFLAAGNKGLIAQTCFWYSIDN